MARSNTKQKKDRDGKHRKETTEEKRARLESQQQAREVSEVSPGLTIGSSRIITILQMLFEMGLASDYASLNR
jgi:hypothetical protein